MLTGKTIISTEELNVLRARVAELESCLDIIINLHDSEESRIARTYRR